MSNNLKFRGQFFSLLKGGPKFGWAVMLCRDNSTGEKFSVYCTNNIPSLRKEYDIELQKNIKNFKLVSFFDIPLNKDGDTISFIVGNARGIGSITAEKMVKKYGENVLEIFKNDDKKVDEILTESQAESIRELLKKYVFNEEDINFFKEKDLFSFYETLKKVFPIETGSYVSYFKKNDVFSLYLDFNINIQDVDKFAAALEYSPTSPFRVVAYTIYIIKELETENNTLFSLNKIYESLQKYIDITQNDFSDYILKLNRKKKVKIQKVNGIVYVSTYETYKKELYIFETLQKIQSTPNNLEFKNTNFESLDEYQKKSFEFAFKENVSIISGGPGTGKTFLIESFIRAFEKNDLVDHESVFVLTPTGRTASNIASKTNIRAKTIHSFLGIATSEEKCQLTDANLEKWKNARVIIIDEFSMVNLDLFYKLLSNCINIEKLILIGDYNQLPAIGAGNILYDLVNSTLCYTHFLKNNYRIESQKIFDHYNAINDGTPPPFLDGVVDIHEVNFKFFDEELKKLFLEKKEKYGIENLVVLAPTYKWSFGLVKINNIIQTLVNKNKEIVMTKTEHGTEVFYKVGDKVMQQLNRNDENIYNGDIGYIVRQTIEKVGKQTVKNIFVAFNGIVDEKGNYQDTKTIKYTESEFRNEIILAYATTIHKFQGSEIDSVIMMINKNHEFMLSKKLIYTGVSRTKKHLTILGNKSFYINLLQKINNKQENIITNLKLLLPSKDKNQK